MGAQLDSQNQGHHDGHVGGQAGDGRNGGTARRRFPRSRRNQFRSMLRSLIPAYPQPAPLPNDSPTQFQRNALTTAREGQAPLRMAMLPHFRRHEYDRPGQVPRASTSASR